MLRYNFRYQVLLILSDVVLVMGSLLAASALRIAIPFGIENTIDVYLTPPFLLVIAAVIWVVSFGQVGVYDMMKNSQVRFSTQALVQGHLMACLLFMGALYVAYRDYSRLQAIYFFVITFVLIFAHRVVLRLLRERIHLHVNQQRKVLIVGTHPNAYRIGQVIGAHTNNGLRVVGYVRTQADEPAVPAVANRILGSIADFPVLINRYEIDEVLVAVEWFDQAAADLVSSVIRQQSQRAVNVRMVCDYRELAYFHVTAETLDGLTLISLREAILSPAQRLIKRLFDIVVATLALVISSPVALLTIIAIKLDSPGPVIFKQQRVGEHGRVFTIYKFRTMYINADSIPNDLPLGHKDPNDPRITRVGRWLRRASIDELPQFVNVLRGDLSVVGPRPELTSLVDYYEWWQRKRFEVPQGITGWWQVTGRSDKPLYSNTEDDLFYIRNYSLWLDVQIVFMTLISLISGRGAY